MEEITAVSNYIRMSPRKLRLVAATVIGLQAADAVARLAFLNRAAVLPITKTLKSAIANAVNNKKLSGESLKVKNILVDEGARFKRYDKSHSSRAQRGMIQKKTSHVKVILEG